MAQLILKCHCEHKYQDKKYGVGMRVHNECAEKNGRVMRCTVCGQERNIGGRS